MTILTRRAFLSGTAILAASAALGVKVPVIENDRDRLRRLLRENPVNINGQTFVLTDGLPVTDGVTEIAGGIITRCTFIWKGVRPSSGLMMSAVSKFLGPFTLSYCTFEYGAAPLYGDVYWSTVEDECFGEGYSSWADYRQQLMSDSAWDGNWPDTPPANPSSIYAWGAAT